MDYGITILLWTAFCVLHSLTISNPFIRIARRILGRFGDSYRLLYNAFAAVTLVLAIRLTPQTDAEQVLVFTGAFNWIRLFLFASSLLVLFWCLVISYDPLEFIGLRQIMRPRETAGSADRDPISRRGLLGIVRHPMYDATIILLWSSNATWTDILVRSILTLYVFIGTMLEERKLVEHFGKAYTDYQKEVPAFIPRLRRP